MNYLPKIGCDILFDGDVLDSLNFFLDRYILYFFLGDYFLVVLLYVLDGIVIGCNNLSGNLLNYFSLFILHYFSLHRHSLNHLPFLIFGDFLFVGYVAYAALTFVKL